MPPWVAKEKIETLLLASEMPVSIPGDVLYIYIYICGSVNEETFNTNLELLDIPAGKWNHLRQRMARRLLEVQDTVTKYQ